MDPAHLRAFVWATRCLPTCDVARFLSRPLVLRAITRSNSGASDVLDEVYNPDESGHLYLVRFRY